MLPLKLYAFDIIAGNPPWGFEEGLTEEMRRSQEQAKRWCEYFGWPAGYKEPSQEFIARSLSLLKPGGECGLLLPLGVFLKHQNQSKAFRRRWLAEVTIKTIVNFSHVRHEFFTADAPFVLTHFIGQSAPTDHWVHYWSAKKTERVKKSLAVILTQPDIRQVKQLDLAHDDFLWKVYWWGNHRDAALIKALRLNPALRELAKTRNWPEPGRGFQAASPSYKNVPGDWLDQYQELPLEHFHRYGQIDETFLRLAPQEVTRLPSSSFIQSGWRLLVRRGISEAHGRNGRIEARLEHLPYCFNNSIHGLNVDKAEDWERKILIGILWSSLARYYYFMTTSTWGAWHHEIHLEEVMSLPICFPKDELLRDEIVEIVNTLMNLSVHNSIDHDLVQRISQQERKLDQAIFNVYSLSEAERDLILDLCHTHLEFLYRGEKSLAASFVENVPLSPQGLSKDLPGDREQERGIEGYLSAFLNMWNPEIAPEGEFRWRVVRPSEIPMIAVVLTTQEVGDVSPIIDTTDEQEWAQVLERCSQALGQEVSQRIYIDSMVRVVTDTEIYIIKRNERRFWTRSMAREDAEAALVQLMHIQDLLKIEQDIPWGE
ncbi:MAG TPA: N-6 DNA methylase [Ktedonobacteraceae bacterium]